MTKATPSDTHGYTDGRKEWELPSRRIPRRMLKKLPRRMLKKLPSRRMLKNNTHL